MKLATLRNNSPDGSLIVVNKDLTHYAEVRDVSHTLQEALQHWGEVAATLEYVYQCLSSADIPSLPLDLRKLAAPLPRAYQWLDGSAYLSHVERVRKARGAEMPPSFLHDPLMYQGGSDCFLAAHDSIAASDEAWGIDLEAEVAVVTDYVPCGIDSASALEHIKLIALVNDVSLRNLIPAELAKGFGFLHGKPPTAFAPVMVTPDELGDAWRDGKLHLRLKSFINDQPLGDPDAGADMQFDFGQLIAHAAKTRPLSAGTIIGSGTVSNHDLTHGVSCLAEKRVLEIIEMGEAQTPFLKFGDRVRIEMCDADGQTIFGAIDQQVTQCQA